jgi:hypothetical protein
MHVERTRDIHKSVKYCSSLEKRCGRIYASGFTIPKEGLDLIEETEFYDWQRQLLAELGQLPHRRRIIWYYDQEGGCGKTELARHIISKYENALYLASAAGKDMIHMVAKQAKDPKIIIINLSRQAEGKFSYASVEAIKDGLIFSGKYEGCSRVFPRPHVVIFSNWYPDLSALTLDRWDIRVLRNNPPRIEQQ